MKEVKIEGQASINFRSGKSFKSIIAQELA